jgi:hypothetical protein
MPWTRPTPEAVNPRSIGVEGPWIPVEYDQLDAIAELVEERYGYALAAGIAHWLRKKAMGRPDTSHPNSRTGYRKVIRELEVAGIQPPQPTGGVRIRQGVEALAATGVDGIGEKAEELVRARAMAAEGGFAAAGLPLLVVVAAAAAAAVARTGTLGAGLAFAAGDITSILGGGGGRGYGVLLPFRHCDPRDAEASCSSIRTSEAVAPVAPTTARDATEPGSPTGLDASL